MAVLCLIGVVRMHISCLSGQACGNAGTEECSYVAFFFPPSSSLCTLFSPTVRAHVEARETALLLCVSFFYPVINIANATEEQSVSFVLRSGGWTEIGSGDF